MQPNHFALTTVLQRDALVNRLRLEAKKMGMTNVARQCGMDPPSIYRILAEGANPSLDSLVKIASAMGFQIELKQHVK